MHFKQSRKSMRLRLFSLFVVACTFLLLIAGGMVTSTGSGLAVPDWPLSYGQLMPPMVGGIFYEHGHRMIASFVGFLTVILTVWIWRTEQRKWVRGLGVAALAAVIFQGALGGLTVLFLLPTAVSASHATLAQTFFCIVIALAFVNSRWWHERDKEPRISMSWYGFVVPFSAVFVQLILGALMRHSQAGLSVPDFPLAYGGLFPDLSDASLKAYTEELVRRDYHLWADGQITAWQIVIHLAHRYWALVVTTVLVWYSVRFFRMKVHRARFRTLGWSIVLLLIVQVTLGIATVLLGRPAILATMHQSAGAALLGLTFLSGLHFVRLKAPNEAPPAVEPASFHPEGLRA